MLILRQPARKGARKSFGLNVELLDDRVAPAVVTFNNALGNGSYQANGNWNTGAVPTVADTAAIPGGLSAILDDGFTRSASDVIVTGGALSVLGASTLNVTNDVTATGGGGIEVSSGGILSANIAALTNAGSLGVGNGTVSIPAIVIAAGSTLNDRARFSCTEIGAGF